MLVEATVARDLLPAYLPVPASPGLRSLFATIDKLQVVFCVMVIFKGNCHKNDDRASGCALALLSPLGQGDQGFWLLPAITRQRCVCACKLPTRIKQLWRYHHKD